MSLKARDQVPYPYKAEGEVNCIECSAQVYGAVSTQFNPVILKQLVWKILTEFNLYLLKFLSEHFVVGKKKKLVCCEN